MTLDDFFRLSSALTGYDEAQLQGTGVGQEYFSVLSTFVPVQCLEQMQQTFADIQCDGSSGLDDQIRSQILASELFGPVARNILKMWYVSTWFPLPLSWQGKYAEPTQIPVQWPQSPDEIYPPKPPHTQNETFIISDNAYIQGLCWDALQSHPMGAKQPGWATWSFPPDHLDQQQLSK